MSASAFGEAGENISSIPAGKVGDESCDARFERDIDDLRLAADLVDAASDLSVVSMLSNVLEASDFPPPGIFDFIAPRIDLEDSFVSDLLIEGYAWRLSDDVRSGEVAASPPVGVLAPSLDLEGCCPILENLGNETVEPRICCSLSYGRYQRNIELGKGIRNGGYSIWLGPEKSRHPPRSSAADNVLNERKQITAMVVQKEWI